MSESRPLERNKRKKSIYTPSYNILKMPNNASMSTCWWSTEWNQLSGLRGHMLCLLMCAGLIYWHRIITAKTAIYSSALNRTEYKVHHLGFLSKRSNYITLAIRERRGERKKKEKNPHLDPIKIRFTKFSMCIKKIQTIFIHLEYLYYIVWNFHSFSDHFSKHKIKEIKEPINMDGWQEEGKKNHAPQIQIRS